MKQLIKNHLLKKMVVGTIFLGAIQFFIFNKAFCQVNLYYGGKFGTSISQFTNQQPHTNAKQGITAGVFVGYPINEKLSVQLEFNYLEEGGQLLDFQTDADLGHDTWYITKADNQKLTLHNIDIPVMAKYAIPLGNVKLYAILGADLVINIYANNSHETTVYADDGNITTYTGNEEFTSNIERYSAGALGGIGFEIPVFTNNYILIEGRYKYGITTVYKGYSYRGIPQISGDLKNNTMYFTIGFGF